MTNKLALIYASARDGKKLQELHPEVAGDYQAGMSLIAIAEKYKVSDLFDVNGRSSRETIVHRALWGCDYDFREHGKELAPYNGLLDKNEMNGLAKAHMKANGNRQKDNGKGIFGLSKKDRIKNASLAGRLGGAKGARKAHTNRGNVLWEDIEILTAGLLKADAEYHAMRDLEARVDRTKIARKLNELCHNGKLVRDAETVGAVLYREREYIADFLAFIERTCR